MSATRRRTPAEILSPTAAKALAAAGYSVVDTADLRAWEARVEASNERNKAVASAAIKAAGLRAFMVEVLAPTEKSGIQVIICDPHGDERATCEAVVALLRLAPITADLEAGLAVAGGEVRDEPGPSPVAQEGGAQ